MHMRKLHFSLCTRRRHFVKGPIDRQYAFLGTVILCLDHLFRCSPYRPFVQALGRRTVFEGFERAFIRVISQPSHSWKEPRRGIRQTFEPTNLYPQTRSLARSLTRTNHMMNHAQESDRASCGLLHTRCQACVRSELKREHALAREHSSVCCRFNLCRMS